MKPAAQFPLDEDDDEADEDDDRDVELELADELEWWPQAASVTAVGRTRETRASRADSVRDMIGAYPVGRGQHPVMIDSTRTSDVVPWGRNRWFAAVRVAR